MKKLLSFLLVLTMLSCEDNNDHEVRYSPDGKDSTVYVRYVDNSGNTQSFWMNYMMFQMLMNNGGYSSVYNYHRSNYNNPIYRNNYNRYTRYERREYGNVTTPSSPSRSYTPAPTQTQSRRVIKSYTPSSPSRTYTKPSSPSRSYTPSKSYTPSSPSRSYTPSRTYSSPSRTMSSPSRR